MFTITASSLNLALNAYFEASVLSIEKYYPAVVDMDMKYEQRV